MSAEIFMWWVFPILVGVVCFGWLWYQKRYNSDYWR